jgi:rod shape-determining protein MreD
VSISPLGLLTLPKLIMGYVAGLIGRSFLRSNYFTVTLLVFCGSICKGLLTLFLSLLFSEASWADLLDVVLPESVYNAILAYPLFFIFDRLFDSELAREN